MSAEIERMAKAICIGNSNPLLFEQALIIAEADLVLRCVGIERIAAIERLRDITAAPLAEGDTRLARGRARTWEGDAAWAELQQVRGIGTPDDPLTPTPGQMSGLGALPGAAG